MARAFKRRGDRIHGRMNGNERAVVAGLIEQTRELLAPDQPSTGDPLADFEASLRAPDEPVEQADRDPALQRLLPDAHRGEPSVAAEFRRLTEQDLRQRKHATFTVAIDALLAQPGDREDSLDLSTEQAQALMVSLTDVRLLLAERMGLREEADLEALTAQLQADPEHGLGYAFGVYEYLTWLQDSVVGALLGRRLPFLPPFSSGG